MLRTLEVVIAVLIAFWIVGVVTRILGGLIHIALVLGVVLLVIRLMQGANRSGSL